MGRTASYDREQALEAAMALFWRRGYHATSLKDLEAALKMKPGSIYAAFSSKENLYLLSLARYFETGRARFRAQIAAAPSPLAGLADHLRIYPRLPQSHIARQACMLSKTLIDTGSTDPEIAAQSKAYLAGMRAEFETVFRAAQEAGEIPAARDPARLARRYQANITALRFELHQGSPPAEIAALAEDMAQEIESLRMTPAKG